MTNTREEVPSPKPGQSGDWTIDQAWHQYTDADHQVWRTLFERQMKLLPGRACDAFVQGLSELPMSAESLPDFAKLNEALMARSGWQVVAVPGLLPDDVFFTHLSERRFPAGRFIRGIDQLDYLQEPDIFHDVFGHVPMLLNPVMADFIQAYGQGGLRAQSLGVLKHLARVYWYTVEFGLVQQAQGVRIYGAGIASSFSESRFCLEDRAPNHLRFCLERVMRTKYRIDDFQESYFVLPSLEDLLALAKVDFAPIYKSVASLPDLEPGAVLDQAEVLQRGRGRHVEEVIDKKVNE